MDIDYSQLTNKSRQALNNAYSLTKQCHYAAVEPQVMMVAVMREGADMVPFLLSHVGADRHAFLRDVSTSMQSIRHEDVEDPSLSHTLQHVLGKAIELATRQRGGIVALEHIFWAFSEVRNPVGDIMRQHGITPAKMKAAVMAFRHNGQTDDDNASGHDNGEGHLNHLLTYATDMVSMAQEGNIEPVIGRDEEIRRVLQIITRKTKNNPVLVGQPGTGKTAIVEGLTVKIAKGDVPEEMRSMRLFALDLAALIAGAQMQGEFEQRLKKVIEEAASDPSIVLFIDEMHLIIGAGKSAGAMDAANILKPALARGTLKVIGATTPDEYRLYVEKDKAFERRFQKVMVEEPDVESSIAILRGIKQRFENHHSIKILDEAIVASVRLSHRYIADRFLPDKAIDLLDEAASAMRLDRSSAPHELETLRAQIRNKEIERESLVQDESSDSQSTIQSLEREIADLSEREHTLCAKWQNERQLLDTVQRMNEQLQQMMANREACEQQGRYGEAVELKRKEQVLKERIEVLTAELNHEGGTMLKTALDERDIMRVVTAWTGIPMTAMTQDEQQKLLHLEENLHQHVVGQDKAICAVAKAIRRNRVGLGDAGRPIGSFLFLGTTGVGKTELCKALALLLFDSADMMVRIDMSEYQQEHSVSRLFGAPPGYVGYDQGGQLTEAVRRKPFSVILFDEIEKAHPKVFETLLQVLDDGRMTDGQGRVVDFKNTLIVMTSNLGQAEILRDLAGKEVSEQQVEETTERVTAQLKRRVAAEFINRIDDIVMFLPLTRDDIRQIVNMHLQQLRRKMGSNDISVNFDDSTVELLTRLGYNPEYGARPVKRAIYQHVVDTISTGILSGEIRRDSPINVYADNGTIKVREIHAV